MRSFIAGGAGFIGSHLAHRIWQDPECETVIIYDNFSSGKDWHIQDIVDNPLVVVIRDDINQPLGIASELHNSQKKSSSNTASSRYNIIF